MRDAALIALVAAFTLIPALTIGEARLAAEDLRTEGHGYAEPRGIRHTNLGAE